MSRRTTDPVRPHPRMGLSIAMAYGACAGILGVAGMTVAEKVEQFFTGRPGSEVPGWTLAGLFNFRPQSGQELWRLNMAMHYGQGAVAAILRGLASYYGLRGPFTDFMFTGVRLVIDQSLENWTGVGAPPWTWPVSEQVIDLLHKAVFALVTGYFADPVLGAIWPEDPAFPIEYEASIGGWGSYIRLFAVAQV